MKKLLILFVSFLFAFYLSACSDSLEEETVTEKQTVKAEISDKFEEKIIEEQTQNVTPEVESFSEDTEEYVVYRTKTGKKYHRDGCIHLKSKYELTIEEAEERGLTPCSVCQP